MLAFAFQPPTQAAMCPLTGLDPDAILWSVPPSLTRAAEKAALEGENEMPVELIWVSEKKAESGSAVAADASSAALADLWLCIRVEALERRLLSSLTATVSCLSAADHDFDDNSFAPPGRLVAPLPDRRRWL